MKQTVTTTFAGKEISIETGRMAKQADGSVVVSCGNNMVLVTAVSSKRDSGLDFFPLTVEYQEKFYATGKIPGGYFKREGRPSGQQILTCRLIDRPLRPLFPDGYNRETQIVATVLSADGEFPVEILSSLGASAALHISDIPFSGPNASIQLARIDGKFVGNPSVEETEKADLVMIVSGTREGISMVEGECKYISEADALAALKFGHEQLIAVLDAQDELRKKVGSPEKREFTPAERNESLVKEMEDFLTPKIKAALGIKEKLDRYAAVDAAKSEAKEKFVSSIEDKDEAAKADKELGTVVGDLKYDIARAMILDDGARIDGRDTKTVRPIACEAGILPRAHGSGLFTRGETQVLGTVTLGTSSDEQIIDGLLGNSKKSFMLHYNFPPYCVGETGRMGGQSRREVGHGFLAERALEAIIPDNEKFPYSIRIVSEVLESNGS
ncbi:MAG: polyribonucleotide nucleotidyltransferase, partial [Bdellovibrionaceae bacterium]|nr:polyribonucleotide nucleotidyltransferase [Pseudobdellovibrionaceae bacterium]